MRIKKLSLAIALTGICASLPGLAQAPAAAPSANPLDAIPDNMPFDIPYGGIPLVENGKLIGAIGCSGGTGSQDEAVCKVAAATVK